MDPIGYLIALNEGGPLQGVCCSDCLEAATIPPVNKPVPLYAENVLPYRQCCASCHKQLVEGRTPSWPELFPSPGL